MLLTGTNGHKETKSGGRAHHVLANASHDTVRAGTLLVDSDTAYMRC